MLKEFLKYIEEEGLFDFDDKILLAVSGGIDSVVLSHLMSQSGYSFGVAHCNFGLRADESDSDELFVTSLASRLNTPYFCTRFDTKKHATKNKISTQMAARELRYEWFEELLSKEGYNYIATAHHMNDAIETTLFNFSKGTGIAGLRGILPKSARTVRPMLFASRLQISAYAKEYNIEWQEDSSNSSDKYIRNMVRLNVIPHLKSINPSLESSSASTFKRLRDVELIFKKEVELFKKNSVELRNPDVYINISHLKKEGARTLLYECLKEYSFNFSQIDELCNKLDDTGKTYISDTHVLNIDREYLLVSHLEQDSGDLTYHINEEDELIMLPHGRLQIDWDARKPNSFSNNKQVAYLDKTKLTYPLIVRKWKQGDTFHPLGMTHKKKLSDFMIDEKIPLNLKERVFIMQSGKEIVWVIGHRIDNRYKISTKSKSLCKIEFITPS